MQKVVVVSAKRTPIGKFMGGLSTVPAPTLGAIAIKGALAAAGVEPSQVEEVYMGNVLQAGVGQRQHGKQPYKLEFQIQYLVPRSIKCVLLG